MNFYVGLHMPAHAHRFARCMVSVSVLRKRTGDFAVNEWILDSGAFTEVARHGGYRDGVEAYAQQINRWARCGDLVAAVAQDWMCEPFVVETTGLTVSEHQRLTIARYDALVPLVTSTYVLPVIQGYAPAEYAQHVRDYGDRLADGAWVGVGSVCKRNATPLAVVAVFDAIHAVRPDLRLHAFGIKLTALANARVRHQLRNGSADSMAWSFAARMEGGNANGWSEAAAYVDRVHARAERASQSGLFDAS